MHLFLILIILQDLLSYLNLQFDYIHLPNIICNLLSIKQPDLCYKHTIDHIIHIYYNNGSNRKGLFIYYVISDDGGWVAAMIMSVEHGRGRGYPKL